MIDDATRHLDQVLQGDPTFVPAIAYMNQLIRARADYAADATGYQQEIAKAEEWAAKSRLHALPSPRRLRLPAPGQRNPRWSRGTESEVSPSRRAGLSTDGAAGPDPGHCSIQRSDREDGRVMNATVVSGHPLLVPAATEAIKQWEYSQTLLNGKPTEVITQADVNFVLNQ